MGGSNVAPVAPAGAPYTKQDLEDAYASLLNDLNEAYWAANDLSVKDQIYGFIEEVTKILAQLDAVDLEKRDAAYSGLLQQVKAVNKGLQDLQQQINTIIRRISTAATIISDVAKVLTVAAKVFPAV